MAYDAEVRINTKINLSEFKDLKREVENSEKEVERLSGELDKLNEKTSKSSGSERDILGGKIDETNRKLDEARRRLVDADNAFEQFANNHGLDPDNMGMAEMEERLKVIPKTVEDVAPAFDKMKTSSKKAFDSMKKNATSGTSILDKFGNKIFSIIKRVFVFALITKAFQAMVKAMQEGFKNLASYSNEYNNAMSGFKSQTETLKNSLAGAFAPIVTSIIPMITQLVSWLNTAVNAMSKFIAIMSGKGSYTVGVKQNIDYAKSLDKVGGSADSAKGKLAAFDDIQVLDKESSGGGGSATTGADAFEEVPIEQYDTLKTKIEEAKVSLKDMYDSAKQWADSSGITDAFNVMVEAFKNSALSMITSAVTIGSNIAQGITNSIALWFSQEKDTIAGYLSEMFNIAGAMATLKAQLWEALAVISEVFTGENFAKLGAGLLGIFSSAFMGITLLASKLALDLLTILFKPIIDNAEKIKETLDGFVGTVSKVVGTIKQFVDDLMDDLNELYDEYIHPFLSDVADGLSDTVNKLLDLYNAYVAPVLDRLADKIQTLYDEHIRPFMTTVKETLGEMINTLRELFNNVLKPLFDWLVAKIIPVIMPIIEKVFTGAIEKVGRFIDRLKDMWTIWKDILVFLQDVFKGDWEAVWNDVGTIFEDIWTGVKNVIKDIINDIIEFYEKMVNGVIKALNAISVDIPEVNAFGKTIGGQHIGFDLEELHIPRLATGGVVTQSTIANIGENGREVVLPIENNTEWMDALASKIGQGANINIQFTGDLAQLGRILKPVIDTETARIGFSFN